MQKGLPGTLCLQAMGSPWRPGFEMPVQRWRAREQTCACLLGSDEKEAKEEGKERKRGPWRFVSPHGMGVSRFGPLRDSVARSTFNQVQVHHRPRIFAGTWISFLGQRRQCVLLPRFSFLFLFSPSSYSSLPFPSINGRQI